jgi:tetratricopeptide (TPR) repeat protein
MILGRVRRWIALVVLLTLSVIASVTAAGAQTNDEFAILRGQLSGLYGQGRHGDAIPLAERYLGLARRTHGEEHVEYASALNSRADLHRGQGRYAEAEPLYTRALAIREKALGREHPDVAEVLGNLADLYCAQGRPVDAGTLYERSLAIREKALGPDHRDVAGSLSGLGDVRRVEGRFAEAELLYTRALAIREKALGSGHPDVANALADLADLYRAQGRVAEAEPLHKRAHAVGEAAFYEVTERWGKYDDPAEDILALQDALTLEQRLKLWPETSPSIGPRRQVRGTLLRALGNSYYKASRIYDEEHLEEAIAAYEAALAVFTPEADPAEWGRTQVNLANAYRTRARDDRADNLERVLARRGDRAAGRGAEG